MLSDHQSPTEVSITLIEIVYWECQLHHRGIKKRTLEGWYEPVQCPEQPPRLPCTSQSHEGIALQDSLVYYMLPSPFEGQSCLVGGEKAPRFSEMR